MRVEDLPTEKALVLLETLKKKQEIRKDNPLLFYEPHPGQLPFHSSRARIRIVEGGNRGGKSTCGMAEALAHVQGSRPWLPKEDPHYQVLNARGKPVRVPNTGIIVGESFKTSVQETLFPKLKEWCPPSLIQREVRGAQGIVERIEFTNGSSIRFMAYNQELKEFEGTSFDWCWFDEPPPQQIFYATQRGLVDRSGRTWLTMTPLREPWVHQELTSLAGVDKAIYHVRFDSYTNPHVSREDLDAFFARIKDPFLREARKEGKPLHLQGLIFPEWKSEEPYWIPFRNPRRDWIRIMGIDPHPRKPIACLWVAISPESEIWYVYRELYDDTLKTVGQVSERIHAIEGGEEVVYRIIDPSSRENEKTSGSSVYELFMDHGIDCDLAQKHDLNGRIELLHEKLEILPFYNVPSLQVMDSCPRLRFEFMNYVWGEWSLESSRQEKDPKPTPRAKNDDLLAVLMYLLQSGVSPEDYDPEVLLNRPSYHTWSDTGVLRAPRRGHVGY